MMYARNLVKTRYTDKGTCGIWNMSTCHLELKTIVIIVFIVTKTEVN